MSVPFPSPTLPGGPPAAVLLGHLDYFRATVVATLAELEGAQLRTSAVASGWTPLELVNHLTHVERRWLVWGFAGRDVGDPWADQRDGHWAVDPTLGCSSTPDASATSTWCAS